MGILSWLRNKKKERYYARIILEVNEYGVQVRAGWKRPEQLEQVGTLVQQFGSAIVLFTHGKFLASVQTAIAESGTLDKDQNFAKSVLVTINNGEQHFASNDKDEEEGPSNKEIVVRPGIAFRGKE